jgi:nitrite reductase (NO-forming)
MVNKNNIRNEQPLREKKITRAGFMKATATLVAAGGILSELSSCNSSGNNNKSETTTAPDTTTTTAAPNIVPRRVAADPAKVPSPLKYKGNQTHQVTLICTEVIGEIESGKKFRYLTFNEQVPRAYDPRKTGRHD